MFHEVNCHVLYWICGSIRVIVTGVVGVFGRGRSSPFLGNGCHGVQKNGHHGVVEVSSRVERLEVHARSLAAFSSLSRHHFLQEQRARSYVALYLQVTARDPSASYKLAKTTCAVFGSP